MRPSLVALCAVLSALLVGCQSGGSGSSGQSGGIAELHLLGTPVAVDLDGKPGPDGVGVRVYANAGGAPQAVRITSGTLSLTIFDGSVQSPDTVGAKPLASFSYSAAQLRKFEHETAIGISYNFLPTWGDHHPTKTRVTVIATYKGRSGNSFYSTPITVPLGKQ